MNEELLDYIKELNITSKEPVCAELPDDLFHILGDIIKEYVENMLYNI